MASSTPASEALIEGPLDFITVKTTLPARPLPAHASRQPILTPRLMIRPFAESDIHALRVLRTQPEVMRNTAAGRIDLDVAETQAKLALSLPPNDAHTFNCAICLRDSGEFVGCGGCHVMVGEFGWPVLGYMFVKEHWGRGFATEEVCELRVDRGTVRVGEDGLAEEQYTAVTVDDNVASQRILTKTGFVKRRVYSEIDSADPKGEAIVTLLGFTKGRPKELQSLTC
ncbi:Histone H3 [Verticillium dahliae VDG1]|nr:Histone H3 [Verticillium dahliae VDG1]